MSAEEASKPRKVYGLLVAGLLSVSASPILVRFAGEAPAITVASWRTIFALLMLLPFAWPRVKPELKALTRRDLGLIVAAGVMLGVHFITWTESLYHTSVASATVLVSTSPIFMAVLGLLLLKERLRVQTVVAIVVAFVGCVIIAMSGGGAAGFPRPWLGNTLALAAALSVTGYLLVGRVVRQHVSWLAYVFPLYAVVMCTVLGVALVQGVQLFGYPAQVYICCALIALGPQLIGHGSFNYALKYFSAAWLGLLSLIEPVLASIAAFFLFGEQPVLLAIGGMVLVLVAVSGVFIAAMRA